MCPLCMTTIALIATGSVSVGGLTVFEPWDQKLSQPARQKKSVTEDYTEVILQRLFAWRAP